MSDKEQQLTVIEESLSSLLKSKQAALPDDFNQTRFLQNCVVVLQDIEGIENIEVASIGQTLIKGAFLNLDFLNKECYAIPYNKNIAPKGKPAKWVKRLQFQTDYKGERKVAKLYSVDPVRDIYAMLVREGDSPPQIKVVNGVQTMTFVPLPFNDGEIIGVLGVILYTDGSYYYETMTIAEVDNIRDTYAKKNKEGELASPSWKKSRGEMVRKTMIRRIRKQITIELKNKEQHDALEEAADFEFDNFEEVKPDVKKPQRKSELVKKPAVYGENITRPEPQTYMSDARFKALITKLGAGEKGVLDKYNGERRCFESVKGEIFLTDDQVGILIKARAEIYPVDEKQEKPDEPQSKDETKNQVQDKGDEQASTAAEADRDEQIEYLKQLAANEGVDLKAFTKGYDYKKLMAMDADVFKTLYASLAA